MDRFFAGGLISIGCGFFVSALRIYMAVPVRYDPADPDRAEADTR